MFIDKYVASVHSSNLRDDEQHHLTDALHAAALADLAGAGMGALLSRVKFADGSISKDFESGSANLAQLLRLWQTEVAKKGADRQWVRITAAWDVTTAPVLYRRVAQRSMAYWLDGKCNECHGTGITSDRRFCVPCKGVGKELMPAGFENDKVMDMVNELEGLVQAHNARAAKLMRRLESL